MTLEEIILEKDNWKDRIAVIKEGALDVEDNINEYHGGREVRETQVGLRKDKLKTDGSTVSVNKIPVAFAKRITRTAASFLFGKPVSISTDVDIDITPLKKEWENMRMDPKLLQACEKAKAYQQIALLFKFEEGLDGKYQTCTLLSPKEGALIPIWGAFDKMDAFMWETNVTEDSKEVTYYYIYDQTSVRILKNDGDDIIEVNGQGELHGYDRMPIVYIEEEDVEWEDVKPLIDRYENRLSRFADTNDYFSSPFFKAKGKMGEAKPEKDDTGTVYELDIWETDSGKIIESDLDVVSWDAAPEATKMEMEILKGLIFDNSFTPDVAFDNIKGLGNISGVAIKLMFMASIMKRDFAKIVYEVAVKRVINLVLSGMRALAAEGAGALSEATFYVQFNDPMPDHIVEAVQVLTEATVGRAVISQKTALEHNPLVSDVDSELAQIQAEEDSLGGTEIPGL
jgi:SPP1 family phage portal protein